MMWDGSMGHIGPTAPTISSPPCQIQQPVWLVQDTSRMLYLLQPIWGGCSVQCTPRTGWSRHHIQHSPKLARAGAGSSIGRTHALPPPLLPPPCHMPYDAMKFSVNPLLRICLIQSALKDSAKSMHSDCKELCSG